MVSKVVCLSFLRNMYDNKHYSVSVNQHKPRMPRYIAWKVGSILAGGKLYFIENRQVRSWNSWLHPIKSCLPFLSLKKEKKKI